MANEPEHVASQSTAKPDLEARLIAFFRNEYKSALTDLAVAHAHIDSLEEKAVGMYHRHEVVIIGSVSFLVGVGAGVVLRALVAG